MSSAIPSSISVFQGGLRSLGNSPMAVAPLPIIVDPRVLFDAGSHGDPRRRYVLKAICGCWCILVFPENDPSLLVLLRSLMPAIDAILVENGEGTSAGAISRIPSQSWAYPHQDGYHDPNCGASNSTETLQQLSPFHLLVTTESPSQPRIQGFRPYICQHPRMRRPR